MKIAVVILNWNGKTLLEQFLPSVVQHSKKATIYLADNASTDDSIAFAQTNFPSVQIIKNNINDGYAKGYNQALQHIESDIFCLLNNDVEVTPNWLTPIITLFENEPNTAIVQPKILDFKRKDHFEYAGAAGGFIDKFGYPYCRGRIFNTIEKDEGQYDDVTKIFWASGACFFIRKKAFNTLHGFDEAFFAHMEEIDLCWRANNLDYDIKYVGTSAVYHLGGGTLKNSNPKKTYLNFRNSLFTLAKNVSGNAFSLVLMRLILDGVAGIKFVSEFNFNHTMAILKAHFSFYGHLSSLLKERKKLIQQKGYYQKPSVVFDYFVKRERYY
jgi:GT2 family glycosyltransferase